METITTIAELRAHTKAWRMRDEAIALVPTMGNLHDGHLKLVQHAKAIAPRVVVSIFVNPMQFAPNEDYESYPLTMGLDTEALMEADADVLFAPGISEVYPGGVKHTASVVVPGLNSMLEGEHRPSHFNGVTTVVAKLFNMVQPDIAVFGEKDYQQLLIVERMARDLNLPVRIEAVETVREEDGLAMSSRNNYLQVAERAIAPQLYQALLDVKALVEAGETDFQGVEHVAAQQLTEIGLAPDYVSIRRQSDLAPPTAGDTRLVVLAAVRIEATRLIDNVKISIT
ncbi:MAG: pantoate--beta-alanine ligase [Gammaproteobacteria bacterium]|nr:pantoate--beta-alanine ligase [Zetaproteobacteria bacterium]MCK5479491.1 pantoate--beta-alanine ligase [Gammaproteobacteria bacterium]